MTPMTCSYLRAVSLSVLFILASSLPMQSVINQRGSECLYDRLSEGESMTLSVFILSGPELKATVTLDGPVAPHDEDTAAGLLRSAEAFDKNPPPAEDVLRYSSVVDFEHLKAELDDDEEEDEGEEDHVVEGETEADQRRREREQQRRKFMADKQRRERQAALQQQKVREDGEPFLRTEKAPAAGWYRMCVEGTWFQVLAEMELRKESELGGLTEDGHVITYEERVMAEEDKLLEQDTASEEGIQEEDFEETRTKLKELRKLLNKIQTLQQKERRRLTVHAETNEHSHSRMVLSSLLETVLFMGVTGFQVYTIRKWFSAAPMLGR